MQIKLLTICFYCIIACVLSRYVPILMLLLNGRLPLVLNWSYVNKDLDSESYWFCIKIKKDFLLSPVCKHYTVYLHIQEWKGYPTEENQQLINSFFFSKQTCLKNEWRNLLHYLQRKKWKTAMNEWKNDELKWWWALHSVYKNIRTILFPYLLANLFKERYISSVKSYKYLNKFIS